MKGSNAPVIAAAMKALTNKHSNRAAAITIKDNGKRDIKNIMARMEEELDPVFDPDDTKVRHLFCELSQSLGLKVPGWIDSPYF